MIEILCGSNRPQSRSMEVSELLLKLYKGVGAEAQILDLRDIPLSEVDGSHYSKNQPRAMVEAIDRLTSAEGIVVVCPEYNGSMPGVLKYFIDHWRYPDTFEYRPVCFVGLGGRFGGLRPIEHLQQVFGYRNSYVFPERIFISNVWSILKDGQIEDPLLTELLERQTRNFVKFTKALESQSLDANSILKQAQSQTSN